MRDNFELIQSLLKFESSDTFYFLQILKRKKDNPDLSSDTKVIDSFFLYEENDLMNLKNKIIEKCNLNNARAYLRLNARSLEKAGLQTLRKITELIINKDYKAIKSAYHSVCGEYSSDDDKKWVIDLDEKDLPLKDEIKEFVSLLHKQITKENYKIICEISTKTGIHIISNPFNLQAFKMTYPNIQIQKDSTTILYIP